METLAAMPEGSTIMRYNMTKREVFYNLLCNSLERFVDRETGECAFDSKEFRDLAGFLEEFPDEVEYESVREAEEEIKWRIKEGTQMLEGMEISWPEDIGVSDGILGERASFVGYPTADGSSGSFFYLTGTVLGMSSTCRNKGAAWDYIRTMIAPRMRKSKAAIMSNRVIDLPVNRNNFEVLCWYVLYKSEEIRQTAKVYSLDPMGLAPSTWHFRDGSEVTTLELISEEHIQRVRDLIDHTTQLFWPEDELSDIVWDTLGAYFAGDRTMDDTIGLLNNRVGLYLNEQK